MKDRTGKATGGDRETWSRRKFLAQVSGGVAVVNLAGALGGHAAGAERTESTATVGNSASPQLVVPDAPGKKTGWAVVGLGSLAINQILPAFAKCEKSHVVALVSGHPDKANKLALRYGVSSKNIYNYQNYDSIRDNSEVDVIYVVLPNGMHAEYTVRGLQAGKHVVSEKPMARTPGECQQMIDAGKKANRKLMVASLPARAVQQRSDSNGAVGGIRKNESHCFGTRIQYRRSEAVATQSRAGGGRLADGYRDLCAQRGPILERGRADGADRDEFHDAWRRAIQGSGRDDQFSAAIS